MVATASLEERILAETARLVAEFGGVVGDEQVRQLVRRSMAAFEGSTVADFVPLLVHRDVREQLKGVTRNV